MSRIEVLSKIMRQAPGYEALSSADVAGVAGGAAVQGLAHLESSDVAYFRQHQSKPAPAVAAACLERSRHTPDPIFVEGIDRFVAKARRAQQLAAPRVAA